MKTHTFICKECEREFYFNEDILKYLKQSDIPDKCKCGAILPINKWAEEVTDVE